jgi:hypothetical protein
VKGVTEKKREEKEGKGAGKVVENLYASTNTTACLRDCDSPGEKEVEEKQ